MVHTTISILTYAERKSGVPIGYTLNFSLYIRFGFLSKTAKFIIEFDKVDYMRNYFNPFISPAVSFSPGLATGPTSSCAVYGSS